MPHTKGTPPLTRPHMEPRLRSLPQCPQGGASYAGRPLVVTSKEQTAPKGTSPLARSAPRYSRSYWRAVTSSTVSTMTARVVRGMISPAHVTRLIT